MSGYATTAPVDESLDLGDAVLTRSGDAVTLVGGSGARLWRLLDGTRTVTEVALTAPEPNVATDVRPGDFVLGMVLSGAVRLTEEPAELGEAISSEVVWVEEAGHVHLLDVGAGTMRTLDAAESALWRLLDHRCEVSDLEEHIPAEGLSLDQAAVRRQWLAQGLLVTAR